MTSGKSVRLFLADGTPGGLVTAEIMNWTGHVIAAPRSELAALLQRPEVSRTGIYLLLGDDPESPGGTVAYIGEGDDVGKRLRHHARAEDQGGKDFWDRAIVLTSKDMNLTKAHARYLESRFITLAHNAQRARLVNGTAPQGILLPEADASDMEFFMEQAKIILPVLGVNLLRSTPSSTASATETSAPLSQSPQFTLSIDKSETGATAQEIDGEFIVREGSRARSKWTVGSPSYRRLREQLEQNGTLALVPDGKNMVFIRDYVFASPSAAAACALGRSANGRLEWKVQGTKQSYGQWQESLLEQAAQDDE